MKKLLALCLLSMPLCAEITDDLAILQEGWKVPAYASVSVNSGAGTYTVDRFGSKKSEKNKRDTKRAKKDRFSERGGRSGRR